MQWRSDAVSDKWFVVPVVFLQALVSIMIYAGLPVHPYAQLYFLAVFLSAVFFGIRGVALSSLSSALLLANFGYVLRGLVLPELPQLIFQAATYFVVGFFVASCRYDMLRHWELAEKLKWRNAELTGVVSSLTIDNAELLDENASLRRAKETTINFIGSVAHDLVSPLTAVRGNAQALLRMGERLNAEKRTDLLQGMVYGANQLLNAVDNLLDVSLIENGHFSLEKQEVSVHRLVNDCVRMLSGAAGEHTIDVDVMPNTPTVRADPANVSQVLVNLLTNAMKYSPPKSKIAIKVEHDASFVAVSVKDEGFGIAEEDVKRIFERYYRTEGAHVHRVKGTGLGLSISKDIVNGHGGELTVDSKLGSGSVFTFTLPVYKDEVVPGALMEEELMTQANRECVA